MPKKKTDKKQIKDMVDMENVVDVEVLKEQKEKEIEERKKRADVFIEEVKALQEKHKMVIACEMEYTKYDIRPKLVLADLPEEEEKEEETK